MFGFIHVEMKKKIRTRISLVANILSPTAKKPSDKISIITDICQLSLIIIAVRVIPSKNKYKSGRL